MKKTKFAYLFATTLVAGTMGLVSCSEEGENPMPTNGETTKVAISMSLEQQTRATADQVNMGSDIQNINNVIIVPMVNDIPQNVISLGTFDPDVKTTHYKTATIPQTVSKFRVYGNLPGSFADNAAFVFPSLAQDAAGEDGDLASFVKPHGLYYYAEAGNTGENKFQIGTGANWEAVTNWTPIIDNETVGTNTFIKIGGVKYSVGVLAAGVLDGSDKTKKIFKDADGTTYSINDLADVENPFILDGIVVEDQPKNLTETFAETGGNVRVYETAASANLLDDKISFGEGNKISGANIYCVVAPENKDHIIVNFRFQNKSGKTLVLNSGEEVAAEGYLYLYATLRPDADNDIFSAATSTLLNATVQDWGRATTTIVETTDVAIGVEISTAWAKGLSFDENI